MDDLHSALKTTIVQEVSEGGIRYKLVRLQHSKDDFVHTLHVHPSSFTAAGLQSTDLLNFMGFRRNRCVFHDSECYVKRISADVDISALAKSISTAYTHLKESAKHLEQCGIYIDQPEGWGFFYGKPSLGKRYSVPRAYGNGHVAPHSEKMKESEDEYFHFVLTWIKGAEDKGWTTHYRAKHMPLSPEFSAALDFLGGFSTFNECPEFDFEFCWWRFFPFEEDSRDVFRNNAEYAHRYFDAHAKHFSPGLEQMLAAHSELQKHDLSFLTIVERYTSSPRVVESVEKEDLTEDESESGFPYDVAISFAGTERQYADRLAHLVRDAGHKVFYDDFYPEQLWGKDLFTHFDRIYRKDSRFCVIFVSSEYSQRIWTTHERRSAQARALEEKGNEYILPIRVDETELDGLPPTVGYLSLDQYSIEEIAELLVKKLKSV